MVRGGDPVSGTQSSSETSIGTTPSVPNDLCPFMIKYPSGLGGFVRLTCVARNFGGVTKRFCVVRSEGPSNFIQ